MRRRSTVSGKDITQNAAILGLRRMTLSNVKEIEKVNKSMTRLETIKEKFPLHFSSNLSVMAKKNQKSKLEDKDEIPEFEELEYELLDILEAAGLDNSFNRLKAYEDPLEMKKKPKWQRERERAAHFLEIKKQMNSLYNVAAKDDILESNYDMKTNVS